MTRGEIFSKMVMQLHIDVDYILHRATPYEISVLLDYEFWAYKDGWEQARTISYVTVLPNSKRALKETDIMRFGWERSDVDEETVSNATKQKLQAEAEALCELINKRQNGRESGDNCAESQD